MPVIKRLARMSVRLLLAAVLITVLIAWGCSALDFAHVTPLYADGTSNDVVWSVQRWDRAGAVYIVSHRTLGWSWSPSQAAGPPDTPFMGDCATAWASKGSSGQPEWLALEYANPVVPKTVRVYENFNPGAVDRVTVSTVDGEEIEAWHGADPMRATGSAQKVVVSEIPLNASAPVRKVTLYMNSQPPTVPGWNEIDAVELVGASGERQWAVCATASSTYTAPSATPGVLAVEALLPRWGDFHLRMPDASAPAAREEIRAFDGRGWPLTAFWCERDAASGVATAGALGGAHRPAAQVEDLLSAPPASTTNLTTSSLAPLPGNGFATSVVTNGAPPLVTAARPQPALPIRIIWRGFLGDTVFFALLLAALRWLLVRPWRLTLEVSRMRQGRCISCGYDLGYDFIAGCPECGWRRTGETAGTTAAGRFEREN